MTALVALTFLISMPEINILVAPDQPVPHVYADEPVVVELNADEDLRVDISVRFWLGDDASDWLALGNVEITQNGPRWLKIDAPQLKGRYKLEIKAASAGEERVYRSSFCLIDRPSENVKLPAEVRVNDINPRLLHAMNAIGANALSLDLIKNVQAKVDTAVNAGFSVVTYQELSSDESSRLLSNWRSAGNKAAALPSGCVFYRRSKSSPGMKRALDTIVLAVENEAALEQFVSLGKGIFSWHVMVDSSLAGQLGKLRELCEGAGHEGVEFAIAARSGNGNYSPKAILLNLASKVSFREIPAEQLFLESFGDGYVHMGALARRIGRSKFMGELNVDAKTKVLVFRTGPNWAIAAWSDQGESVVKLQLGEAADLRLTDANNNTLTLPKIKDGTIQLPVRIQPVYLSGKGGQVVAQAALNAVLIETQAIAELKTLRNSENEEWLAIVELIRSGKVNETGRAGFFTLLGAFPLLEEQRHKGEVPANVAVPASAAVARLVRSLCILEQDKGEPFLDSLHDTLAKCEQHQTRYITESSGLSDSRDRGDWLMGEVARLMEDSEELAQTGRSIEADAVALLAVWRARSLQFVADVPLTNKIEDSGN